jgi:uncharacterized alkaline shock family protein YloU
MEGQASISADILSRYAADAAREVAGVRGLAGRRPARIGERAAASRSRCTWTWSGAPRSPSRPEVQEQVRAYLERMAELDLAR